MPRLGRCFYYNSKCILLIKYCTINHFLRVLAQKVICLLQTLKMFAPCLNDEPQYEPVFSPSLDFWPSEISF
jgi:hypothetical protein